MAFKNHDSFHRMKFMKRGNIGSWKRDEWIQWTVGGIYDILFSIVDSLINHCHRQCEKYIRCHLLFISLSGFFSDVIFKIYILVLFYSTEVLLLITKKLLNVIVFFKNFGDCSCVYCESQKEKSNKQCKSTQSPL